MSYSVNEQVDVAQKIANLHDANVLSDDSRLVEHAISNDKVFWSRGCPSQQKWVKVDSLNKSSFSGSDVMTFRLPMSGILEKNTFHLKLPTNMTISANEAQWAKGVVASCIKKRVIKIGGNVVSEIDEYGKLVVKHMKYNAPQQSLLAKDIIAGYYASATDVASADVVFLDDPIGKDFLKNSIPLFLCRKGAEITIEYHLDGTTNNFTSTNTGSNARTLTITNPQVIYRENSCPETIAKYQNTGMALHFNDYFHQSTAVASGANLATISHQGWEGRLIGSESYLYHDADLANDTDNAKLWKDQINDLTGVKVYMANKQIVMDRQIEDPKTECWLLSVAYAGYATNPDAYQPSLTSWGVLDNDFRIAIPVSHAGKNVHSGYKDQAEYKINLIFNTASEDLTVHTWFKMSKNAVFSPTEGFVVDERVIH